VIDVITTPVYPNPRKMRSASMRGIRSTGDIPVRLAADAVLTTRNVSRWGGGDGQY